MTVDNYRAITLSSVISEALEKLLLHNCEDELFTNDTQFGFKPGIGCSTAIFATR